MTLQCNELNFKMTLTSGYNELNFKMTFDPDIPKVVKMRRTKDKIIQDCDIYIGRANNMGGWNLPQSKWANTFKVKEVGSVHKACELYLEKIIESDLFHDIPELKGKILGCWCVDPKMISNAKPNGWLCHGCVLAELFRLIKAHNFDTHYVQSIIKNN